MIFSLEVVMQSPLRFLNGKPVPYDYQITINVLLKSTDLRLVTFSYEIRRKSSTLCERNMDTSRKCRSELHREPLAQT